MNRTLYCCAAGLLLLALQGCRGDSAFPADPIAANAPLPRPLINPPGAAAGGGTQRPLPAPLAASPAKGPQGLANGLWLDAHRQGMPTVALVSDELPTAQGRARFFYVSPAGPAKPGLLRAGEMRINDGAVAADLFNQHATPSYLRGRLDVANALTSDVYNGMGELIATYRFTYRAESAAAPDVARLVGRYAPDQRRAAGLAPEDGGAYFSIAQWPGWADGVVKGSVAGCAFVGSVRPSASGRGLYTLDLVGHGPACIVPGRENRKAHLRGLAALVTLPGERNARLVFAASSNRETNNASGSGLVPLASVSGAMLRQR